MFVKIFRIAFVVVISILAFTPAAFCGQDIQPIVRLGMGGAMDVKFSPNGKYLAIGSSTGIWLYDVSTLPPNPVVLLEGHTDDVNSVAFSPDGRILASGADDETIKLWGVEGRDCIATLEGHTSGVSSAAFSPDGRLLASGSKRVLHEIRIGSVGEVKLWSMESKECVGTWLAPFPHEDDVNSVAFSPDGKLLASGSSDSSIILWSVEGKDYHYLQGHTPSRVTSLAFSPDGSLLVSADSDSKIRLWGGEYGESIGILFQGGKGGIEGGVAAVTFSPDGRLLASGFSRGRRLGTLGLRFEGELKLWDIESRDCVATLEGDAGKYIAFSPDGKLLVSGSCYELNLWKIESAVTPKDKCFITWASVKQTALFQNYPNPFNPETWFPYQLKEESEVVIRIYSPAGNLVRELDLGHQPAGLYLSPARAAHWDGRDKAGEPVVSGVYFYALHAGPFHDTKKMVIVR